MTVFVVPSSVMSTFLSLRYSAMVGVLTSAFISGTVKLVFLTLSSTWDEVGRLAPSIVVTLPETPLM